ncbi:MliC family protein [Shewanella salipaludis]|uniref:MliC family protein n=1 Tax=Shewanella salipaludis TaxID=2723052 RepID=UPI0031408DAA
MFSSLVEMIGPMAYACDGNATNPLPVAFFDTEPATLIADRGDSVSPIFIQPGASGARYQGRNQSFWEHHGEARISWGYGAPEMSGKVVP